MSAPDGQRVEQAADLLDQVRQRQERDEPVLLAAGSRVDRVDRRERRCRGSASRPWACRSCREVKTSLEQVLAAGVAARRRPGPPSRAGRVVVRLGGQGVDGRASGTARAARRADPARRGRCRWPGAAPRPASTIRSIASGAMRRSSGTTIDAGPDRPEVDGRQLGRRRRPGQQPVAGLEPERAQPPGHDPAPPVELAEAPVGVELPSSRRRPEGRPVAVSVATASSRMSSRVSMAAKPTPAATADEGRSAGTDPARPTR